jgi:hypothetical protein
LCRGQEFLGVESAVVAFASSYTVPRALARSQSGTFAYTGAITGSSAFAIALAYTFPHNKLGSATLIACRAGD